MAAVVGPSQVDGRRYVTFSVALSDGTVVTTERGPLADTTAGTLSAIETEIGAQLESAYEDAEAASVMSVVAPIVLRFQTAAQFAGRIREAYRSSSRDAFCRIAYWIIEMIAAGHLTDAQMRTAFGLTSQQWTNFKTAKVQPAHDAWAVVLAAQGE